MKSIPARCLVGWSVLCCVACTVPKPPPPMPPTPISAGLPLSQGIDKEVRLDVGPPDATLATWVIEPKAGTPLRGTVILLHGFLTNHSQVMNAGAALRKAGYRTVLVDLRGFGESSGAHITFGVQDAHDLTQLTNYLQAHDLCGRTLGVYGTSYGAGSAILYAAADPRVTTVVAVAPFADIRAEVAPFSRQALGPLGGLMADSTLNAMAKTVAGVADLDLVDSRPLDAIQRTQARILLIHGEDDTVIPHAASEQLHAADPRNSELVSLPHRGHLDLCFDLTGELQGMTRQWFDEYLAAR